MQTTIRKAVPVLRALARGEVVEVGHYGQPTGLIIAIPQTAAALAQTIAQVCVDTPITTQDVAAELLKLN